MSVQLQVARPRRSMAPAMQYRSLRALPSPGQMRDAIVTATRTVLGTHGYHAATYACIASLAGVEPGDVRRLFPKRRNLILEALGLPVALGPVAGLLDLSGEELVTRYLAFWETAGNTAILRGIFRAAVADERVACALERYLTKAFVRPLAEGLHATDACPRIRLVISYLVGLTLSRYLLMEEPLGSADRETVAAWAGPSVDTFLHGSLPVASRS